MYFSVEALAVGVALGLLHALERIFVLLLRFEDRDGQSLGAAGNFDAEEVVDLARTMPTPPLGASRFDGRRSFQSDVRHAITLVPQDRVNQLVARFRFVLCHFACPDNVPNEPRAAATGSYGTVGASAPFGG